MSVATGGALLLMVAAAWLGMIAFLRLATPLARIHVVTFVNVAGGAGLLVATLFADGLTSRTLKVAAIWLFTLLIGACLSHVTGRALHLRGGERR